MKTRHFTLHDPTLKMVTSLTQVDMKADNLPF